MRTVIFASLSAITIGFIFSPGATAAPIGSAAISEAASANSPVVKTRWGFHRHWRRGWYHRGWRRW